MLLNLFFDAITGNEIKSYENLLMLDFIFHKAMTLNDYLLLYRREIIRQKAFQQASCFEEYVAYFKTTILLGVNIGKNIPYDIKTFKKMQIVKQDDLLIKCYDEDYSMPPMNREASMNSEIEEVYYANHIESNESSITSSIDEYYTDNVSETLQYLFKTEKIIHEKFILTKKLNHLLDSYLSPLINREDQDKTPLFYDDKHELKKKIEWNEYARQLLLKLFIEETIKIDVGKELNSIYKKLILHKIKHSHNHLRHKEFISNLNEFIQELELYSHNETIHTSMFSLSTEKTSLVKILWYICEKDQWLIYPFISFISNIHGSHSTILLQQLTHKNQKSALMIAISNNNYRAFKEILTLINRMNDDDKQTLLNLKDDNGNNCLMIAAQSQQRYVDEILAVNKTLSTRRQTTLLMDTNFEKMNALMIAITKPTKTLSAIKSSIKRFPPESIRHMIMQKNTDNFYAFALLLIHKPNEAWELISLFKHLRAEDIYLLLSSHTGPEKNPPEKTEEKSSDDNPIPRSKKLAEKHAKTNKQKIKAKQKVNIFQYSLNPYLAQKTLQCPNAYRFLFRMLNKLPPEKKEVVLLSKTKSNSSIFHLAFSKPQNIAEIFASYLKKHTSEQNRLTFLKEKNFYQRSPADLLIKFHGDLLVSLLSSFSSLPDKKRLSSLCQEKNRDKQSLLTAAILHQPNTVKRLLDALEKVLPAESYCNLLSGRDGHHKSILINVLNANDKPLFIYLIQRILKLKDLKLRDDVIEKIFTFQLRYSLDETYSTITPLLECLNDKKNFKDLPSVTHTLNPNGWSTLSLSVANHPDKLIENLTLYQVIKHSKLNIAEVNSFWYRETPTYRIKTANKLIRMLAKRNISDFLNEREIKVLKSGRLNTIINAYNKVAKTDLLEAFTDNKQKAFKTSWTLSW